MCKKCTFLILKKPDKTMAKILSASAAEEQKVVIPLELAIPEIEGRTNRMV